MSRKFNSRYEWETNLEEFRSLVGLAGSRSRQGNTQGSRVDVAVSNGPRTQRNGRVSPMTVLERNMDSWGIHRRNVFYPEHDRFREAYKGALQRTLRDNTSDNNEEIRPILLPSNPRDTILKVLDQELDSMKDIDPWIEIVDSLAPDCGGAPYTWNLTQRQWILRPEFEAVETAKLNPLERYSANTISAEEHFREIWKDPEGYRATAFRALVGQEACQGQRCIACNKPTIRWNFATKVYPHWTKLYCVTCKSSYEIKTPEKEETLRKRLDAGILHNTAFYGDFQKLVKTSPGAKQYVVLVTTEGLGPHAVWVGQITNVDPQLKDRSFLLDGSVARIYSRTAIEDPKRWFQIPVASSQQASQVHQAVRDMLDVKFGTIESQRGEARQKEKEALYASMNRTELKDHVRSLKRQRNHIQGLLEEDKAVWSVEDRQLVESQEDILEELEKAQSLLYG